MTTNGYLAHLEEELAQAKAAFDRQHQLAAAQPTGPATAPRIGSKLRNNLLQMPAEIDEATGIIVYGRRIKSLIFTTDLAIIRNCDADAVFAVYPFTPQQSISDAIIQSSYIPVFCGVGGGITSGMRSMALASDAESQGAMGVIMNAAISDLDVFAVSRAVDIPVVITIASENTNVAHRIASGMAIANVAAGTDTPGLVKSIRREFPQLPIIATGGGSAESIRETIAAGANAITCTPPSTKELFSGVMERYRAL